MRILFVYTSLKKKGRSISENLSYGNNQLTDKRGIAREYYYI